MSVSVLEKRRSVKAMPVFKEVLPKTGLVYNEETSQMVLCKPKLLPLKSVTLEKLEKMQKEAQEILKKEMAEGSAVDSSSQSTSEPKKL